MAEVLIVSASTIFQALLSIWFASVFIWCVEDAVEGKDRTMNIVFAVLILIGMCGREVR